MERIFAVCRWLAELKGRPVVVIGDHDAYLFQGEKLIPLNSPRSGGYEGYRTQIRQIGEGPSGEGAFRRLRGLLARRASLGIGKPEYPAISKAGLAKISQAPTWKLRALSRFMGL